MEDDDSIPPNVSWPDGSSGFEASPWSPAGQTQAGWRFASGLQRRWRRHPAVGFALGLLLILYGIAMAALIASYVT